MKTTRKQNFITVLTWIMFMISMSPVSVAAETIKNDSTLDLVKQEQNPLTRFYTLRFEDNAQFGFGPDNEVLNFFRIQPLIPFDLNENWSLITRAVIPIAHQPWPESTDGLSDISLVMVLTPARTGKFIWGVGPALLLPTATDEMIGTEKWSAGPAVVGVYTSGPWNESFLNINCWYGDNVRFGVPCHCLRRR